MRKGKKEEGKESPLALNHGSAASPKTHPREPNLWDLLEPKTKIREKVPSENSHPSSHMWLRERRHPPRILQKTGRALGGGGWKCRRGWGKTEELPWVGEDRSATFFLRRYGNPAWRCRRELRRRPRHNSRSGPGRGHRCVEASERDEPMSGGRGVRGRDRRQTRSQV